MGDMDPARPLDYEPVIRLGFFVAVFVLIAVWERRRPRRALTVSVAARWVANLAVVALNTLVIRLLFRAAAVGAAVWCRQRGWGLFNILDAPAWVSILVSVVMLDLTVYTQHVIFHAVPVLWRVHRMHHSDLDLDVTTGARFHPVEIMLSMLIKVGVVMLIGAPATAVLIFEVLLNATSMFNHGNIRLPARVDRIVRRLLVTPDMHRIHHSIETRETNSNFGFNLSWWDRLFGTYRDQPAAGHDRMTLGLPELRDPKRLTLGRLLILPFRR
jgi:sterol desaturase/sphingolipid hydroxylase (fatty acid hydroxylase superfamily)